MRAKAERVLAEIDVIDMELDRAVEAYNGATVQLETINRDLAANQKRLVTARANLAAAHKRVANRVLALYTSQEPDALAVLLGASSFGDLIERIDSVNRISKDDVRIAEDVTRFRNEVRTRQGHLVQAQARQRTIVAQPAARRSAIVRCRAWACTRCPWRVRTSFRKRVTSSAMRTSSLEMRLTESMRSIRSPKLEAPRRTASASGSCEV